MAENTDSTYTPIRRLLRLTGQFRREIRYVLLYAVVAGIINLTLPLGIQAIIGQIAGGSINASWGVLVLIVTLGAFLTGVLRIMQASMMEFVQRRIFTDSALEFALRIPRLNLELLHKEHIPELVNRFFDTLTLQKGLPKLLIEGTTAFLQILLSLMLLSFYHTAFVSFSFLLLVILAFLFYLAGPKGISTSLQESKYKYKLAFWLEEVGRMSGTFKLAGETAFPLKRADALTSDYLDARSKHWRILLWQFVSGVVFRVLALGGFLILGSLLVMDNQLNIGQFVASEILVLFVIESVEKLIALHETGYDTITATEKLGQVMDLPLEREDGIRVEEFCADDSFEVELRNLSYQYSDSEYLTLKNINLKIEAGARVAICGYYSSGKSTLAQILSVVKRDFTGTLLFNGLPKQNLHLRSLRNHIGDLSVQEELFKGTILENITLNNPNISLQDVLNVIDELGLSDFVRQSPKGLDTELLPGGKNTPGSIITKLMLARATVSKSKLLVLEEPLGTLTFQERIRIANYLTNPKHSWTLVGVTEDPILAALCDRIVVLKAGEIVYEGTFEEVKKSVHFERIFKTTTFE
jgi:ABC-type bacteriocin/lantibiotic exporter with double-glycine peptidase domain